MCISWTLAVEFDETMIDSLTKSFATPPPLPNRPTVLKPLFFATSKAFKTFLLFPEVVIPTKTSPLDHRASICLEKICSYP